MTARARDDSGQVMILLLGLTIVVFAVAGLAVDGTRAFIMQRSLQNVADSAAVSAASSIDQRTYYSSGGSIVELDEVEAESSATSVLERRGLPVEVGIFSDDEVVRIVVRSRARTGFLQLVGIDGIDVAASAVAAALPQGVP